MRNLFFFVAIFILLFFAGCSPSDSDVDVSESDVAVSGEVFIVTNGAQNIKLGLVKVSVFSESVIQPYVQSKLQTSKNEILRLKPIEKGLREELVVLEKKGAFKGAWDRLLKEKLTGIKTPEPELLKQFRKIGKERRKVYDEMVSYCEAPFYLKELPTPLFTAKTDSDGEFTFKLKPGKYALAASASRKVVDETEVYYWLVWITVDANQQNKVMLSNDNFFGNSGNESVINLAELPELPPDDLV